MEFTVKPLTNDGVPVIQLCPHCLTKPEVDGPKWGGGTSISCANPDCVEFSTGFAHTMEEAVSIWNEMYRQARYIQYSYRVLYQIANDIEVDPNDFAAALLYMTEKQRKEILGE